MGEQNEENRFGKYEILEVIEEGIAGRLCRARHTESGRSVLLRIVSPTISENPEFGRYFYDKWSEQQSLVEHPNVVRVWEVGQEGDSYYVALEDTEGTRLSEQPAEALDTDEALDIIHQVAEGLRAIHRREVFHGHVKPSDIILTRDKLGRRLVKVALFDLGVSSAEGTVSVFGELLGSPKYMAPEVIQGSSPGPGADVFALGVIAYELFTGAEPFPSRHQVGYLFNNCQKDARRADEARPELAPEIAAVIHRMLEKGPARRYRSAQRVIDDLDRCEEVLKTGRTEVVPRGTDSAFARDYELPEPTPRKTPGRKLSLSHAAVLVILVAATVSLAVYALSNLEQRPAAQQWPGQEPDASVAATDDPQRPLPPRPRRFPETDGEQTAREAYQQARSEWERYGARGQYDLGVTAFAEVADRFEDTPFAEQARGQMARIYVEWADALAERSDYAEALAKYHEALALVPEESRVARLARGKIPAATAGLAEMARRRGDYMEALEVYERLAAEHRGTVEARLLEEKRPELLFNQAAVLREQGRLTDARDTLLAVLNEYEGTEWGERAADVLPDIYLRLARARLEEGDLERARGQVRQIVDAYPDHRAAEEAARLDARILYGLFSYLHEQGETERAVEHYGRLLSLYPKSEMAVRAVRERLGLERADGQAVLTASMAQSQLRKAKELREELDFDQAMDVLRIILRDARADSPASTEAAAMLPQWAYQGAMHAYGTGSLEEAKTLLQKVHAQFPGSTWDRRGRVALERIQNPPPNMAYVPDGPFWMGSDLREIIEIAQTHDLPLLGGSQQEMELLAEVHGFSSEMPRHVATTEAFFIGKTEVTNREYQEFVEETGHRPPDFWEGDSYPEGEGDHPVRQVSASDARAYAEWRGGRLPTEAEWEKAARGVDGRRYPWGDRFREDYAHHMRPEDEGPTAVGSYSAWRSPYGCLDMIGNVMEWTSSRFLPYPENELEVPGADGSHLVRRGGSWRQEELARIPTRVASRYPAHPGEADMSTGFRIVMDIPEDGADETARDD